MAKVVKQLAAAAPRWGVLLLALLFGSALMGLALRARQDAAAVERVMARAQGEALVHRLRRELGRGGAAASLDEMLEAYQELGLRYLALYRQGDRQAEAGVAGLPDVQPRPGELAVRDQRYRFAMGPRHGRPPLPGRRGPFGLYEGLELVIEFEALGSSELRRRAVVGLWVSAGATVLLMAAAAFLWRLGRRGQQMEAELTRQRHLATLGEMSAVLAHEIRNPLASLKGHAQLLAEEVPEGRSRGRVGRVVDEAVRLERLTNDLLAFARSGAIERKPVAPADLVIAAAEVAGRDRVVLSLDAAPTLFALDPARMQQVLINLIDNAIDVTPAPARVEVAAFQQGHELVFTVRDRGPGVPLQDRESIFEAFVTRKIKGTGLGLAIARRIVELHGGRLRVDHAPDGGAVFRAEIPG